MRLFNRPKSPVSPATKAVKSAEVQYVRIDGVHVPADPKQRTKQHLKDLTDASRDQAVKQQRKLAKGKAEEARIKADVAAAPSSMSRYEAEFAATKREYARGLTELMAQRGEVATADYLERVLAEVFAPIRPPARKLQSAMAQPEVYPVAKKRVAFAARDEVLGGQENRPPKMDVKAFSSYLARKLPE